MGQGKLPGQEAKTMPCTLTTLSIFNVFKCFLMFIKSCSVLFWSVTVRPKATICCILVSHQELSLEFVRAGAHYHYTIIR